MQLRFDHRVAAATDSGESIAPIGLKYEKGEVYLWPLSSARLLVGSESSRR